MNRYDKILLATILSIAIDATVGIYLLNRIANKLDMLNNSTMAIEASLAEIERRTDPQPEQK